MFVEIVILWLTRYKAEPRCVQKTNGLAIYAYCIYYCQTFIKNYAGNYVTIWESFQIMLPGEGKVVAFCGRILALGRWKLQISGCKWPGVPRDQPPRMAANKCINHVTWCIIFSISVKFPYKVTIFLLVFVASVWLNRNSTQTHFVSGIRSC